ncbi:hypothetical protein D3C72_2270280 [compost metagenome]
MFGLPAAVVCRFLDLTAIRGGNPQTAYASVASFSSKSFQADANAPTVPNFPSAAFTVNLLV